MMSEDGDFKLIFTTADERVEDLKKIIQEKSFPNDEYFDFVTFKPATGNKNYIAWVRKQTLTLDQHHYQGEGHYHEGEDDDADEDDDEPTMLPAEPLNSTEAAAEATEGAEPTSAPEATQAPAATPASSDATSIAQINS